MDIIAAFLSTKYAASLATSIAKKARPSVRVSDAVHALSAPMKASTGAARTSPLGRVGHKRVTGGVSAAGHKANQAANDAVTSADQIPGMGRFKGAALVRARQLRLEANGVKKAGMFSAVSHAAPKGNVAALLKRKKKLLAAAAA